MCRPSSSFVLKRTNRRGSASFIIVVHWIRAGLTTIRTAFVSVWRVASPLKIASLYSAAGYSLWFEVYARCSTDQRLIAGEETGFAFEGEGAFRTLVRLVIVGLKSCTGRWQASIIRLSSPAAISRHVSRRSPRSAKPSSMNAHVKLAWCSSALMTATGSPSRSLARRAEGGRRMILRLPHQLAGARDFVTWPRIGSIRAVCIRSSDVESAILTEMVDWT